MKTRGMRALIVGINKYPAVRDRLSGCVNDARAIKTLLEQKHGGTAGNTRVLTDAEATTTGILDGIRWLAEDVGEDSKRMFYYSGHGSRRHDESGDEPDGWDECLMGVDYGKAGVLLDDTLRKAYAPLKKAGHFLLVMDSCHSGTVNKDPFREKRKFRFIHASPGERVKAEAARWANQAAMERSVAESLTRKAQELSGRALTKDALEGSISEIIKTTLKRYEKKHHNVDVVGGSGVLLAACRDRETAAEDTFGSKRHGALTYFLLEALRSSSPTYEQLVSTIAESLEDHQFVQVPQLECGRKHKASGFFGATVT